MKKQQYQTIFNFISEEISSTDFMLACKIALKLMPYSDALVEMIETKDTAIIRQTIAHDYNGLMSIDEDFLPRLKPNKTLSDLVYDEYAVNVNGGYLENRKLNNI